MKGAGSFYLKIFCLFFISLSASPYKPKGLAVIRGAFVKFKEGKKEKEAR